MTHSSGVNIAPSALEKFQEVLEDDDIRFMQLKLENEAFVLQKIVKKQGDWKQDFRLIQPELADSKPCYIIYRKDDIENFIFMNYIPSSCKVYEKMICASSRDTVRNSIGPNYFTDLFFGSAKVFLIYSLFSLISPLKIFNLKLAK